MREDADDKQKVQQKWEQQVQTGVLTGRWKGRGWLGIYYNSHPLGDSLTNSNDHFSGPGQADGPECVSLCLSERLDNDFWTKWLST